MIHEVKLPRETLVYLGQIVHVQMELLFSAATMDEDFTQENLQAHLAARVSNERAEQLTRWLFRRKTAKDGLCNFAEHNNGAEKNTLFEQMRRDVVRLYRAQDQETLERRFPIPTRGNPLPSYLDGAKKFLVYFYENLGDGFDGEFFGQNPNQYHDYGREQFFAAFERLNPEQYVCAICDEHRHMTILRGNYFSDIEHYFPKSIYPHLSCHPYNLIPICKQCNSAHSNTDPLPLTNGTYRTLGGIFLPYRAESVVRQGVIKLNWQNQTHTPELAIQPSNSTNDTFRVKLSAFSEIYDIPHRWQERIHQIGEQLWRYIRHYIRIEIEEDEQLSLIRLKDELEQLLTYLFEDLGKSPWTYILIWYLGNILVEEIESAISTGTPNSASPILDTVRDVLQGRDDYSFCSNRWRAKEVIETSRRLYATEQE